MILSFFKGPKLYLVMIWFINHNACRPSWAACWTSWLPISWGSPRCRSSFLHRQKTRRCRPRWVGEWWWGVLCGGRRTGGVGPSQGLESGVADEECVGGSHEKRIVHWIIMLIIMLINWNVLSQTETSTVPRLRFRTSSRLDLGDRLQPPRYSQDPLKCPRSD